MAITEVGSGSQRGTFLADGADTAAVAYPASVTSGNLLVVWGACWATGSGNTAFAVTDSRSTPYTVLFGSTGVGWSGGTSRAFLAYGVAPSTGACTVTVDPDGTANYLNAVVDEFTGSATLTLDVNGGESTGSSTTPSDSITTLTSNSLIIGVLAGSVASGIAPGSGLTQVHEDESVDRSPFSALFKIGGAAGADLVDWVVTTTQAWAVYSAAFKEAGGPPAGAMPGGIGLYSPRGTTQPVARGWA